MREWTTLFVEGKSIYEVAEESSTELTTEQLMEFERQALLNEADLHEYRVRPSLFSQFTQSILKYMLINCKPPTLSLIYNTKLATILSLQFTEIHCSRLPQIN